LLSEVDLGSVTITGVQARAAHAGKSPSRTYAFEASDVLAFLLHPE